MGTLAWRGPRLIFVLTLSRAAMGSAPVRVRAMLHHNVDYFPASIAINQIKMQAKVHMWAYYVAVGLLLSLRPKMRGLLCFCPLTQ